MAPIKFYYDLMSQPSRALYIFLKSAKIPFDDHQIALRKGIYLTDEYRNNVNRFQKVPALVDNTFQLSESICLDILRKKKNLMIIGIQRIYRGGAESMNIWNVTSIVLHGAKSIEEISVKISLPNMDSIDSVLCIEAQLSDDEIKIVIFRKLQLTNNEDCLSRQHSNTRTTCSYYFILKYLKPRMAGKAPDDEYVAEATKKQMDETLNTIENLWLHEGKQFIGGSNEVSIADLFGACEIEQPRIAGYDPSVGRPKLAAWKKSVKEQTNPHSSSSQ